MAQNKNTVPVFWAIIILILIILLSVLRFGFGITAIDGIISNLFIWIVVLFILGLVFYAVYWLFFRPHKIDVTYMNKERLIAAATLGKSPLMRDVYLSGDAGHSSVRLGKVIGYARIEIMKTDNIGGLKTDAKTGKPIPESLTRAQQDVIVFKRDPFPLDMIEEPKVLRCDPDDHTELVGDIKIKGFSLVKLSEYYYLNKDHLDVNKIDYNLQQEAKRGVLFLNLADMKSIVDIAIGIDSRHEKSMQKDSMIKIPQSPQSPPAQ